ncbi:hypothetical protein [Paenibacillus gallinarum]|uniref:Uncharacterized protein n=1 Tax=Paenibacillus gallinarum TaxID=2762232 RepID=A0ABR8T428_9BACL|nr:hypothetical protein [Paenibacillus gallinarum]MBD7970339.1 hypothetical protein [Paenibacillus gallinarum]
MNEVWLICKKDGKASAHKLAEQDVEGYVNALRDKGFEEFEISKPEYGINNQGRFEVDSNHVVAEFGTYAAHQPGYEKFKQLGVLDDYVYQSLVHMGNASHQLSWALTVLEHTDVSNELQEEIRQVVTAIPKLQEKLRT